MARAYCWSALAVALALFPSQVGAQDVPESSPTALMHHARGVEAYVAARNEEAISHFRLAYESDPTSYVSLLMAGVAAGNAGRAALADSFYAMVLPHKEKLSSYYRYRLEAQMAGRAGDLQGVIAANRKAAELGPGTKAAYNVAQAGSPRGRAQEALAMLRQLDPEREPMRGWFSYFSVYAGAAHQVGDFEDELRVARRAAAAFPDDLRPLQLQAQALAALGRVREAEELLVQTQAMQPAGNTTPGDVLTSVGLEFGAHGNAAASRRWLENAVKWYNALDATTAATNENLFGKAYALYSLGRYRDAAVIIDTLAVRAPNSSTWKVWTGFLAGLNGDRAKATDVSRRVESGEIQLTPVNRANWLGLIAAAQNDRSTALTRFKESGTHAAWVHRDPMLATLFRGDPGWAAFLKPTG